MSPTEQHFILPPLRKYIFKHSLVIIALYTLMGIVMTTAIFIASRITPKLIHLNYDSIAAASQMNDAWNAIQHPENYPNEPTPNLVKEFDQAITFQEGNITEAGEGEVTADIRNLWETTKKNHLIIDLSTYQKMETYLHQLIQINEKGMFSLATESSEISNRTLIISTVLFLFATITALYLADHLAFRISSPLKELAETLRRKPIPGTKLKLPQPTSLEMRIVTHEMLRLWDRLSELRKLNLEEISSQGKKLEAVLSSVEDAILVLDNQDQVVHCNPGMLKLIGLKLDQILGCRWNDLSTLNENYMKLRSLLVPETSGDQTIELEFNQKKRIFSIRSRTFYNERNEQIGTLYLLHDITEIRQRERLKTEFISVLSHELKTPIQSLGTASEILFERKSKMDEEERMLVETIYEDVGRIRVVANEFIQMGLVDLHSLKLKMEKVPISELLQQWIQPFQILAKDKNVKVQLVKEGSNVIFAKIDIVKFPWSISNLISNAIRVSPPNSTITVYLTDREGRGNIEVQDEGPGIPEDARKNMFDPYFQGGSRGFLGLGLTITKEVVEAHEGRIEYFPRKPSGSIFRISLPPI